MNVQMWTFVMVGLSFALYIGLAIWSNSPEEVQDLVEEIRVP